MTEMMIDRAWDAVPGLREAESALHQARQLLRAEAMLHRPLEEIRTELDAAIRAGDGDQAQTLVAEAARIPAQDAEAKIRAAERTQAIQRFRARVDAAYLEGIPAALRYLSGELEQLVKSLRPHAKQLGAVRDANEAIRAGGKTLDAWGAFASAAAEYEELRVAQAMITRRAFPGPPDSTQVDGWLQDFGHVKDTRGDVPKDDLAEQLRWAVTTGATLWLPGPDELRATAVAGRRRPSTTFDFQGTRRSDPDQLPRFDSEEAAQAYLGSPAGQHQIQEAREWREQEAAR